MKHPHMACEDILNKLNDYIDGELNPLLCEKINAHIESCPDCQVVVNTLKKTIHLYQNDRENTTLPAEARKRLYACLDLDDYLEKQEA